ncbi:nitrogenase component 1 [Treponema primitia]|uniref:nitrogenase component 1 n=1 Tax=Treponema primitia TaxID=88058 RepID=UPI000255540A|nr:nitrogenase component 1 [Treponema primitia]
MSIFSTTPEIEVRERRLHSIISYTGSAKDLYEKSKDRSIVHTERSYSQCSSCAEGCAGVVTHIRDTAVVFHAPIGCDAGMFNNALASNGTAVARGKQEFKLNMLSSNILEQDTIFGATEKLRNAIREADKRFHPRAIFVTTSCASGIIGEDVESVADEMEEELGYPIAPIYCEGFKSRIWSSGFDAAFHGVLRKLVKPPVKKQEDLINVFNFEGTDTFTPILSRMGLRVNYLLPLTSLEEVETISEAVCSTTICETLSMYVAAVLEEKYGVPEVKAPSPYGIDWTNKWLRAIGKITNREEQAERIIKEDEEKYREELEYYKEKLKGKKVYVVSGDSFAHNLANIGKSLGLELVGATSLHHDLKTDNPDSVNTLSALIETNGDIPNFSVCNMQPYQITKILQRLKPDLLVCRHGGLTTLGSKLGIPAILEGDANYSIGYEGVVKMGRRFYEALRTKKLVDTIASHVKLPYTSWWLAESDPFYFQRGNEK